MAVKRSTLESIQLALANVLIDFRQWCMADTQALQDWKDRELKQAIVVASGRMIDDAQAMLGKYRQASDSRQLPIMIAALASLATPPDLPNLIGIPYWQNTVIPTDPLKRRVKFRTIPRQFRMQLAFFAPDPHAVQSVLNQFCAYMTDNEKRRVMVTYDLGGGVSDDFHLTVLENTLYPDTSPTDANNIVIGTVDFNCIGLLPQVIGLAENDPSQWDVIVQSDLYNPGDTKGVLRAEIDLGTGIDSSSRYKVNAEGQVIDDNGDLSP